jgi:hypothetical protein
MFDPIPGIKTPKNAQNSKKLQKTGHFWVVLKMSFFAFAFGDF